MDQRVQVGGLGVAASLHRFIVEEALPGTGVDPDTFWEGADALFHDLAPRNRELLARREELQRRIDDWHREHPGVPDAHAYPAFLREIGYLLDEPEDVAVTTADVDDEVARIAGPQLVVPLLNARFAANAVNARWGSLYDALYGTDVVPREGDLAPGDRLQQGARRRGHRARPGLPRRALPARRWLARRRDVVRRGRRRARRHRQGRRASGSPTPRSWSATGDRPRRPRRCVLVHHGLHVEIQVDRDDAIGATDAAGVKDLLLESAVSTIMDLEDSVAAVDAEDKVVGYRNWLRLMEGTLAAEVTKGGKTFTRAMNPDRTYTAPSGEEVTLPRPLAAVHPAGRPPDDHRRGARPRRQRGARGHPRRAGDRAGQPAGPARPTRSCPNSLHRVDVRRQAEDARARRGRLRRRAVQPRRGDRSGCRR